MAEIIQRSFGDNINYKDLTDPDVRRLVFLAHSDSGMHRVKIADAQYCNWNRQQLRRCLYTLDVIDSEDGNIPGTQSYIHRQWVKSLPYFNPLTYEFQLPDEGEGEAASALTLPFVEAPTGEVVYRSFGQRLGDKINYDDPTDPDVRRLVFLSHSPSEAHSEQMRNALANQYSRQEVQFYFILQDLIDEENADNLGTFANIHREWVESLPYFNPETYEFRLPEVPGATSSNEIIQLGNAVHSQARRLFDDPPGNRPGKVLPFSLPSSQGGASYSPPPISA